MPCHQRKMNLIQIKSGQENHSDYLDKLSNLFSVVEYEQMSGYEFQIHLFIESANSQMAKTAMELLETENPTMQRLKVKVKEIENYVWYNQIKKIWKSTKL